MPRKNFHAYSTLLAILQLFGVELVSINTSYVIFVFSLSLEDLGVMTWVKHTNLVCARPGIPTTIFNLSLFNELYLHVQGDLRCALLVNPIA